MAGMLSQVVSVGSFTLIGVFTVDVLRLVVVTPSMVSVRVRSPEVAPGRQDCTVRSQLVMSYGAGTVTAFAKVRPSLSLVVTVPVLVVRTATPPEIERAESALVESTCSCGPLAFSK